MDRNKLAWPNYSCRWLQRWEWESTQRSSLSHNLALWFPNVLTLQHLYELAGRHRFGFHLPPRNSLPVCNNDRKIQSCVLKQLRCVRTIWFLKYLPELLKRDILVQFSLHFQQMYENNPAMQGWSIKRNIQVKTKSWGWTRGVRDCSVLPFLKKTETQNTKPKPNKFKNPKQTKNPTENLHQPTTTWCSVERGKGEMQSINLLCWPWKTVLS